MSTIQPAAPVLIEKVRSNFAVSQSINSAAAVRPEKATFSPKGGCSMNMI
jgi:hypothetical protein